MPAQTAIRIFGPYTTAERDALVGGGSTVPTYTCIFNSDIGAFEFWDGAVWQGMLGGSPFFTGTVTSAGFEESSGTIVINSSGIIISGGAALDVDGRSKAAQGADVAAANDLVLSGDGNAFEITGATQINHISWSNWTFGSTVTLLFASTPTVKHAQASAGDNTTILLAGAVDFVASAGDTLTLLLSTIGGVQAWREKGRAVI